MNEYILRQHNQMRFKIADFRQGTLGLNGLIQQLEGLARAVGEEFWSEVIFPFVLDLERINSELLDKRRNLTSDEQDEVARLLTAVEARLLRV